MPQQTLKEEEHQLKRLTLFQSDSISKVSAHDFQMKSLNKARQEY